MFISLGLCFIFCVVCFMLAALCWTVFLVLTKRLAGKSISKILSCSGT